jgi:hypothetical protein
MAMRSSFFTHQVMPGLEGGLCGDRMQAMPDDERDDDRGSL